MKLNGYENELLDCFLKSIANHEYCLSRETIIKTASYKIKYIVWFLLLCVFSPHKKVITDLFVCAVTPVSNKRLVNFTSNDSVYCFARLNDSIGKIIKNCSVLSPFKRVERLSILAKALIFYFRNRHSLRGYVHFILEYYAIAYCILKTQPKEIVSAGMYERYCTLFGELGKLFKIKVIGVQDGAAIDIGVPCKVHCDEMYVFDEYELKEVKKFMSNEKCKYICTGFTSTLKWEKFEPKDKAVIAIASQDWFTNKTLELIDTLMKNVDHKKFKVIVFPHYRESVKQYEEMIKQYPDLIVEPIKRYSNVDLLITFYSTIVYDFWSVNQSLLVIAVKIPGFEPSYYGRENVKVIEKIDEIKRLVRDYKVSI